MTLKIRRAISDEEFLTMHIGRHWPAAYRRDGARTMEEECPCPVEPCGHIQHDRIHPDCPQHTIAAAKTIRSNHLAKDCPGEKRPA